jgi:hypothetical protein
VRLVKEVNYEESTVKQGDSPYDMGRVVNHLYQVLSRQLQKGM